ncbi:MAG: hypothetical protein A2Z02_02950 [Chloroflexi bacterium RBG_16_48_7]|nr:MAG: hypothetical protein A2Z02_02950 [Chloroflexi bacterium RBG_16_48_7]
MTKLARNLFITFLSIILILSFLFTGCAQTPLQPEPAASSTPQESPPAAADNGTDNVTKPKPQRIEGVNLPPMPYPDKGNPKLNTFLNGLIKAEKQGEAESFARQRNVKLVDGKVRVEVEAMPGQLDAAANATAALGTVEIISLTLNAISAVVPIMNLTALAEEKSIRFIRQPVSPTTLAPDK